MNFYKRNVLLAFFLSWFVIHFSLAQNSLSASVIDEKEGRPVEFAQIALMHSLDSSLITGTITDLDGHFKMQTPRTGAYLLRVGFVGYNVLWKPVEIKSGVNRLGVISLAQSNIQLDEVQITAAATLFRSEADRRVFNVDYMTIADGATAIQLLEALPSVQLDEEGRITMRGSSNILIYINGRPTNLLADNTESILEQYPANVIKNVELITNPSARYDAEGVGGIINIILKEDRRRGFNSQLNLSAGTGNKYTGGLNMNLRQNRWNHTAGYSYQYRELWEINESLRENFMGNNSPVINLDFDTYNYSKSHLLRLGTEYETGPNSSFRLYSSVNARSRDRERNYNIRNLSGNLLLDSMYIRQLIEDQSRVNYEFGAGYLWVDGNGRRLTANASVAWDKQDRIEYFNQKYFDTDMFEVEEKFHDQFYERPLNNRMFVFELDYEQNISGQIRLETGLKSTIRHDYLAQNFGQLNLHTSQYEEVVINNIPISNQFVYDRDIHAAYVILRNNTSKLSYMAGFRAEMTRFSNWQEFGLRGNFLDESFEPALDTSSYGSYFNLFPSIFLNYKLSENQDIQMNYSRRISRPNVGDMLPFINAQDFFNLRLGNPYLEPAFTQNFEINYIRAWQNYMLNAGVFHRYSTNNITRLFVPFAQSSMVTWVNASTTRSSGLEIINFIKPRANFDASLTGNFYYSLISGDLFGNDFNNKSYSWTLSLLSNMNIPRWFSTQLAANYWGPHIIPQGQVNQVFSMNLGLRRNVFNNQGTLSLTLTDILNSKLLTLETLREAFYQKRDFYNESRILTLSFTWRIRNYSVPDSEPRDRGIERDIEGLF